MQTPPLLRHSNLLLNFDSFPINRFDDESATNEE